MRSTLPALLLGISLTSSASAEESLYDQLGGGALLHATVEEFVDIMLDDKRINFAFANADLKVFKQRLYSQLCSISGGPCRYEGRDMKTAHEKLSIDNAQFNALAEDLYLAMDRAGIN